ncbi:MAG: biopolymer transporter ExbD [Myxococcales bacterium]|nr:biopolymer transporter ExbD [Myxococcales bacterium]
MNFRTPSSGARRNAAVVDITALVDVVFQLLIFFLLTSSYVSQQGRQTPQVPVELPESTLQAEAMPFDDLTIAVDAEGAIFLDAEPVTLEELGVRLARTAERNANTVVLIRGDQAVPYGRIAQIMAIARASRLKISAVLRNP